MARNFITDLEGEVPQKQIDWMETVASHNAGRAVTDFLAETRGYSTSEVPTPYVEGRVIQVNQSLYEVVASDADGYHIETEGGVRLLSVSRCTSVLDFGAIWDGDSHPLSGVYSTLEEAQAVYPHAEALTDEIDWCATQAAINKIVLDWDAHVSSTPSTPSSNRFGGVVILPCGHGRMNRSILYPANSNWTYQSYPGVYLVGQGRANTIMTWLGNDTLDEDDYAIKPATATVTDGAVAWSGDHSSLHSLTIMKGFSIRGPGVNRGFSAPTNEANFIERYGFTPDDWTTAYNTSRPDAGQVYELYNGISAGERTCLEDIGIYNFKYGLNLRGGQKWHRWVDISNCYYGIYGTYTNAAHGDMKFTKCNISGRMAAFAMHPAYAFYGHMDTCFIGGSPYAFLKEGSVEGDSDGENLSTYGGHWSDFMSGVLTHCQFESVGNGIFSEANETRRHEIRDLTLQNCLYRTPVDYSFPATDDGVPGPLFSDALLDVKSWKNVFILNPHDSDLWVPGDEAIFKCSVAPENVVINCADGFISAASGESKHVWSVNVTNVQPGSVQMVGNRWSGTIVRVGTSNNPSIEQGDVIGVYGLYGGQYNPATAKAVLGIGMEENQDALSDQYLCVATELTGFLPINIETGASNGGDNNCYFKGSPTEPGKIASTTIGSDDIGYSFGTKGASQWWGRLS